MGGALSTINKIRDEVTGAINRNLDAETGYIGSPPPKFPKTNNPPGTKNLDLNCKVAKIPEVTKIILYECLDELKNDGSYRFSGMEVYWTDKKTGALSRTAQLSGEQDAWRTKEVGQMDFVKALSYATKNHGGVDYVSFCGLEFQSSDPCGAGTLQLPLTTSASQNPQFVEGAVGFRLIVHKKLKVITQVIPVFSRVSDKKAKLEILEGQVRPFLSSEGVSAERGQKIYDYKAPENKFEDFTSYITSGNIRQEYLGGLPIRLLSPEELNYWQALVSELKLEKLIEFLQTKGNIHRIQGLDKDIKDTVIKFLIKVLTDEFFRTKFNTRYVMKMLCIVFNEDPDIWEQVKKVVRPKYDTLASSLFDDAIDQIQRDAKLGELQKIENFQDSNLEGKFQKSCPQCPDKGQEGDDVDKIAKKYMLDSAQYMAEFYATFRSKFGDKFHGAPVKGLERIRAKCQEYQDEAKAAGKQLSKSDSVAKIMDFLRSTIECGSVTEMINAYNEIQQLKGDYKVVRVKNPFKDMTKKVYKSLMLNIMIFDSIIVEVQITVTKMKEANDINHFIYEYQREHSIYAMVSKNLNLTTAFQEWFDPIAPKSMKTNFPRNMNINWKGFWVEGAATSIFDLGKTKRCYFLMHFKIEDSGNISGECGDRYGNYIIKGKIDVNARTLEFTKTPKAGGQGPYGSAMAGPTYEVNYKAKFIDKYMAEGTYETKSLQKSGMGSFADSLNSALAQKGIFRIWCDDMQLPGLNPTLMAFRDVTKDSKIIRKKWLPTKKMKWTGYMGGTGKDGADQPFTLDMKINNPLNVFGGNSLTGKGKLGKAAIHHIDGAHELYDNLIMDVFVRPSLGQSCTGAGKARDINMNGFFIEDLKLMGIYDDNGHMGRWELECQDADTRKKWAPKGDNEDDRWELLVTYMDGERQYNQVTFKASNDGNLSGTGNNFTGSFKIEGKLNEKFINLIRTQDGEKLEFDGQFITGGLYEGFFRSPTSYGKFKLAHA